MFLFNKYMINISNKYKNVMNKMKLNNLSTLIKNTTKNNSKYYLGTFLLFNSLLISYNDNNMDKNDLSIITRNSNIMNISSINNSINNTNNIEFEKCRPNKDEWIRMDDEVLNSEEFKSFIKNNVIHDTLVGEGLLEKHEIYKKININHKKNKLLHHDNIITEITTEHNKDNTNTNINLNHDNPEIICIVQFGNALNGHPGVVHGGIISMMFDNCFGWVFLASKLNPGFTANLNVNFRYL